MADPDFVPDQLEGVREEQARDAEGGGMGRVEVPRNPGDAGEGEFTDPELELLQAQTPG